MLKIDTASIEQLQAESNRLGALIGQLEMQTADARSRLETVRSELARRLRPAEEPRISDHALLRYIERVHGVDMEALRAHIMTPRVVDAIRAGASAVHADGCRFVIKGNTLVTILDDQTGAKPQRRKPPRARSVHRSMQDEVDEYYAGDAG